MNEEASQALLAQILSKCWTDASYKTQLLADPVAVFQAEGLPVPPGMALRVLEDTAQTVHLVIPVRPADVSDDLLASVAGGQALTPITTARSPTVRDQWGRIN